jgi:Beta-lactamase
MGFTNEGLRRLDSILGEHVARGSAPGLVALVSRGEETHVGKLRLEESVDRLLPELANRRVLRTLASPLDDTVPAARPITMQDVLTFRLGLGVLFDPALPIQSLVADLPGFGMPDPTSPLTPDAYMQRLRNVPLMAQPGERWLYADQSSDARPSGRRRAGPGSRLGLGLGIRIGRGCGRQSLWHLAWCPWLERRFRDVMVQ